MTQPVRRSHMLGSGVLSCLDWGGSRERTMLFSHANGFNAQTYTTLLAPLADDFRVLACDLRGHGHSTLPATPGLAKGWTVFAQDLESMLAAMDGAPAILAGHSLGATASLITAALAPRLVHALVLVEPVLLAPLSDEGPRPPNTLSHMAAQRRSVFASMESALDYMWGRGIFARWPEHVVADYLAGGLIESADGLRLACAPEWEAEIFRDPPFGIAKIAPHVACPLTILRGTVASTAAAGEVAEIRRLKPETRVVTVEGASHFLPIEQPERVRDEIRRVTADC